MVDGWDWEYNMELSLFIAFEVCFRLNLWNRWSVLGEKK